MEIEEEENNKVQNNIKFPTAREISRSIYKKIIDYGVRFQSGFKLKPEEERKMTYNAAIRKATGEYHLVYYKDTKTYEYVDSGIEFFLCQNSPYYFLTRYCTITLPGVGEISCNNLYYYQKEILKDFHKWQKIVLIKSRQTGLSTLTALVFFWTIVFRRDQWGVIISKDKVAAMDVLRKVKENLEDLPSFLNLRIVANNATELIISNPHFDRGRKKSNSRIQSFARSLDAGRGTSPTILLMDEAAFYGTASIIEGIISATGPALSKSHGQLWVVSTPNGSAEGTQGYWYFNQVSDLQEKGGKTYTNDGHPENRLYDISWWEVPDTPGSPPYKGFNDKLQEYIDRDYFNHPEVKEEAEKFFEPIAKDWQHNDWLRAQHDNEGEIKYRQEILKDFVVVGNTVFSEGVLNKINQKVMNPISKDVFPDGRACNGLWIWKSPIPDKEYIIAVDIAKGTSDDSSCIQVLDVSTKEQVAEYLGKGTTKEVAQIADKLGRAYNDAFMLIESNSIGEAVFTELYYNLGYPNLYRQKKNGPNGTVVFTGWSTNVKTRGLITDKLIDYYYNDFEWNTYIPHSSRLMEQCKFWIWTGRGPDHTGGKHDDAIMAMAIALYNFDEVYKGNSSAKDGIMFISEQGKEITRQALNQEVKDGKYEHYYDTHNIGSKKYDYQQAEKALLKSAGLPTDSVDGSDPMDTYMWLFS